LARELHEISETGVRSEGVRETLGEKGKLLEGEVMRVVRELVGTNAEGGVRRKEKELTEKLTRAKTEVSRLQALVKDALSTGGRWKGGESRARRREVLVAEEQAEQYLKEAKGDMKRKQPQDQPLAEIRENGITCSPGHAGHTRKEEMERWWNVNQPLYKATDTKLERAIQREWRRRIGSYKAERRELLRTRSYIAFFGKMMDKPRAQSGYRPKPTQGEDGEWTGRLGGADRPLD
jgi:hypothetical protein